MEEAFKRDTCAEFALSAMVSMIMILLFSAIVAGMALLMIEQAFMESRTQSLLLAMDVLHNTIQTDRAFIGMIIFVLNKMPFLILSLMKKRRKRF